MSWIEHHSKSEQYAGDAEIALRNQDLKRAQELYRLAAEYETRALQYLDQSKMRTLSITAVSATSLWYKSKEYQKAQQVAYRCLGTGALMPFAVEQLQSLLQFIWNESAIEQVGGDCVL